MIVTVTMNPSVDISYPLDELVIDDVNRVEEASKTAGGKGLNVSRVIKQMGGNLIASGILGGTIGTFIVNQLNEEGIPNHFLTIDKESRNCIAILHEGHQTEILESGPTLDVGEGEEFLKLFKSLSNEADIVTISGSLPNGLTADYYQKLLEICREREVKVLVDTSGEALKQTLLGDEKPFLIKPNMDELNALLDQEVTSDIDRLKVALSDSLFDGVEAIVVSMGADGAFAKIMGDFYKVTVPKIKAVSPVGSGDATLAGLALGINEGLAWNDILKIAMTLGMLNTLEEKTGHINKNNFEEYYVQVEVVKM